MGRKFRYFVICRSISLDKDRNIIRIYKWSKWFKEFDFFDNSWTDIQYNLWIDCDVAKKNLSD